METKREQQKKSAFKSEYENNNQIGIVTELQLAPPCFMWMIPIYFDYTHFFCNEWEKKTLMNIKSK